MNGLLSGFLCAIMKQCYVIESNISKYHFSLLSKLPKDEQGFEYIKYLYARYIRKVSITIFYPTHT